VLAAACRQIGLGHADGALVAPTEQCGVVHRARGDRHAGRHRDRPVVERVREFLLEAVIGADPRGRSAVRADADVELASPPPAPATLTAAVPVTSSFPAAGAVIVPVPPAAPRLTTDPEVN
jgi:hypothetical protein